MLKMLRVRWSHCGSVSGRYQLGLRNMSSSGQTNILNLWPFKLGILECLWVIVRMANRASQVTKSRFARRAIGEKNNVAFLISRDVTTVL